MPDRLDRALLDTSVSSTSTASPLTPYPDGRVYAAVRAQGRNPRRRSADLLIAAVALANSLPVVTRNAAHFAGLTDLIEVVEV